MNMRSILKYCKHIAFFIIQLQAIPIAGQPINEGIFTNNRNDLVCVKADTILIRFCNSDAFGTYSIWKGKYTENRKGEYIIKGDDNQILKEITNVDTILNENDKWGIKLLYNDNLPIKHCIVTLMNPNKTKQKYFYQADSMGFINFNVRDLEKINDKIAFLRFETVGFISENYLEIKPGITYILKSRITKKYPFIIPGKKEKILISFIDNNELIVQIGSRKISLYRNNNNISRCTEFLFDSN